MKDKFLVTLENSWNPIAIAPGGQKYLIGMFGDCRMTESIVTIVYPEGDTAEAQFLSLGNLDYFTDGVINSIFKDLSTVVHYYGPNYKILNCDATFGEITKDFGWYLADIVKEGGSK